MNRFDGSVARLPSAINFYRLLEARPGADPACSPTILSHAPALAEQLGRRPELLDGLIDASALRSGAGGRRADRRIRAARRAGDDYQQLLDRVRRRVNETPLRARRAGRRRRPADPLDVADGYARVAEAAIEVLAAATVAEFDARARPGAGRRAA